MKDAELYSGIVDPKKQADYEAWLEEQLGPGIRDQVESSRKKMATLSPAEKDAWMSSLKDIEQDLAKAMRDGTPPEAPSLDPLTDRHFAWVTGSWGEDASVSAYASLADIYLKHPDFVSRYEQIEPGFAEFLSEAMRGWAARQGGAK